MKVMTVLALSATVAVPLAAYYLTIPDGDALGDTLRGYGFVPINPPSNLIEVGSLYYVDSGLKDVKAICRAEQSDLDGSVASSPSWEMQEYLERKGRFATGLKVDVAGAFNGNVDKNYVVKVHSSLTGVVIEEIPMGSNRLIYQKLMAKPECNDVVMEYLGAGNYVCQGQKILQATAEFKLDRDAENKLAAAAKPSPDKINNVIKLAVESQSEQTVVDKEGRLFAGAALKYGVSMDPICLALKTWRFQRSLPHTALQRMKNFILFNIVEPILPAVRDSVEVAQNAHAAGGPK
jgi:hypothetical protein